jgi:hypothetical protein
MFDQTVSLTPPLGGTAQTATYSGPNHDGSSPAVATSTRGIGIKVYSVATVSYFTRDENGAVPSERGPGGARRLKLTEPARRARFTYIVESPLMFGTQVVGLGSSPGG